MSESVPQAGQGDGPLRVALLDASHPTAPGSMATYARMLERAFAAHAPELAVERVRIGSGSMRRSDRIRDLLAVDGGALAARFDVLHLLDGSQALLTARLPAARTIVTVHDLIPTLQARGRFPVPAPGLPARLLIRATNGRLARVGMLCAVSACTAQDVREIVGREVDAVVHLALPHGEVSAGDGSPATGPVLHVGNNGFYKNRMGALAVFAAMAADRPSLALRMIGPPPTAEMREFVAASQLEAQVEFCADPDDDAVRTAYREASVLLFPSRYEGFGWPPLEAMAQGCPVVASPCGSLEEVVGPGALLADPDDVEDFARAALTLLDDAALREAQVRRGRAHAAGFGDARLAGAMAGLYRTLAGRAAAGQLAVESGS